MSGPIGFGFQPDQNKHHFIVHGSLADGVLIFDVPDWDPEELCPTTVFRHTTRTRVSLSGEQWRAIRDEVTRHFNRHLKASGMPAGKWSRYRTPLYRTLGKELVLLAWAIEKAHPSTYQTALANWAGLRQEERWWLFTMTAAATGGLDDGDRGWRKAVRFALSENPVARLGGTSAMDRCAEGGA